MFDLETAIREWRGQMFAAGIKQPVPLDELESHLRDAVEAKVRAGADAAQAFQWAAGEVGLSGALKTEFRKNERKLMKRAVMISLGVFAVLFGPAIFLPALALHQRQQIWNGSIVLPMVLGAVITVGGMALTVGGIQKRKA